MADDEYEYSADGKKRRLKTFRDQQPWEDVSSGAKSDAQVKSDLGYKATPQASPSPGADETEPDPKKLSGLAYAAALARYKRAQAAKAAAQQAALKDKK